MVLSNTKLKRKLREEAAAKVLLNPPPDSNATSSVAANDVKVDSSAIPSAKKKKKRRSKMKDAANGDAKEEIPEADSIPKEGNPVGDEPVQKQKTATEVGSTPVEGEDVAKTLASEENGVGGDAPEVNPAPKTNVRKKPRWELDENGKRVKPQKVGGEGKGPFNGAKAPVSSDTKNTETIVEKDGDGDAVVADAVNNGDRIHQGDEPWLQSKRSKKKKKLLDRWGKKVNDAEAVDEDHGAKQEVPVVASSAEEKVDPKKVMVGGMPYYVSEDDIHEYFQECGTIAELDCMTFPDTGKFKGMAFVTFRTEEAAKRALALDGADMGGRFLKIEVCKIRNKEPSKKDVYTEPPKKYEGCLSAYVGNLSWDITEKELRKAFGGCKIDSVRFAVNKETGEFRGFGHVDFADDESLEAAMKLDQTLVFDRPLKIAYSVPPRTIAVEGRASQAGARKKGCFTCGEEGHMSYNCPSK